VDQLTNDQQKTQVHEGNYAEILKHQTLAKDFFTFKVRLANIFY